MAENNVIYTVVTPDVPKAIPGEQLYVYVPQASFTNSGIAKFNKEEFTISADGLVSLVSKFIREEELNKEQFTVSETGAVSIRDEYIREQALTDISDALAKKLDKVSKETEFDEAYVKDASGTFQTTLPISQGAQANTIVRRKSTGAINVGNAQANYEAAALGQVKDLVSSEASKRDSADKALDAKITAEASVREAADNNLDLAISSEASAREQADSTLQDNIDKKLDTTSVVQETGTAEDKVISQKVVTEKLNDKLDKQSTGMTVYAIDSNGEQYQLAYNSTTNESLVTLGQLITKLLGYLPTSGGTITNDLAIQGNLTVRGTTTTTIEETLNVKDAIVVANADGADLSATLAGFVIRVHTDDCYGIIYDFSSNSIKLGLGMIADGKFVFYEGEGNAVAVRADGSLMTNGHLVKWDATALKFVDAGKSVDDIKSDTLAALTEGDNISITKASDSEKVTISAIGLVKKTSGRNKVYCTNSEGNDTEISYSQTPENSPITQYTSSGTLRTNNPIDNLDAINKQYFEANAVLSKCLPLNPLEGATEITVNQLSTLKNGFYYVSNKTIKGWTTDITGFFVLTKTGIAGTDDATIIAQGIGGDVIYMLGTYASGQSGRGWIKLATTSDVATATAVLIDNSLLGG